MNLVNILGIDTLNLMVFCALFVNFFSQIVTSLRVRTFWCFILNYRSDLGISTQKTLLVHIARRADNFHCAITIGPYVLERVTGYYNHWIVKYVYL